MEPTQRALASHPADMAQADADHAAIDPEAVAGDGATVAERGITGLEFTDEASSSIVPSLPIAHEVAHADTTPQEANEGSSYRPTCHCGWEGGIWQTYEDARFQIGDHLRNPDGLLPDDMPPDHTEAAAL